MKELFYYVSKSTSQPLPTTRNIRERFFNDIVQIFFIIIITKISM